MGRAECHAWKSAPREGPSGGIFHLHEGGPEWSRTWTRTRAVPEILRWRTQFFGQIFLGKILEIKIVLLSIPEERVLRVGRSDSARSDSGPGTHYLPRATPQRLERRKGR